MIIAMKNIFLIYKRDINRLLRNKVAALVMIGVCILPSLYAWFNIAANMDPYSNTQGILVAVADNDTGAQADSITLNAGESIIENLKANDQLGWTFVDESEAVEGVRSGKYYAAIVIPEDFSSSLLSILSGTIETPELDYYINEKKNAIAPKITDTGASTIQQEINDTFSAVASETISELIQTSVGDISSQIDGIDQELVQALADIHDNLTEYQTLIQNFQDDISGSASLIDETLDTLDQVSQAAGSGSAALSDAATLLQNGRTSVGTFSGTLSQGLSDGETALNDIYNDASSKLSVISTKTEQVSTVIGDSISSVEELSEKNAQILASLQELNNNLNGNDTISALISEKIAELQTQNSSFQELLTSLESGNSSIQRTLDTAQNTKTELESIASQSKDTLQNYRNTFHTTVLPSLNTSLDRIASLSGSLSSTLAGISPTAEQLKSILTQLKTNLSDSAEALTGTSSTLTEIDERLTGIITDLQALQSSETYQEFLSLEGLDEESISDFMSSPVSVDSEVLYDVENYGSAMTPFYTNLALWVGGLILVSILKQEVDKDSTIKHLTPSSAYFGRWLLFITVGLIQGLIVCLGDLLLLKVQCLHPAAFICAGMLCSFVYVNLIYALALTFKHIGKALGVILVILQIPGSAGTYPIEMTPVFFQRLHPLLPFTYGINAMRETIAGMYHYNYAKNLLILALFIPIGFFIGLALRPLLMNLNHLFDKRLAETELMLGETESSERNRPQLSLIIRTLLSEDTLKEEFMAKAARFEAGYPRMIRFGFTAMIVIPLIFLVLMFSLESKIVFLVLWIVSLILLALYLICIEYIHDRMIRQLSLAGLSAEDLLKVIKEGNRE